MCEFSGVTPWHGLPGRRTDLKFLFMSLLLLRAAVVGGPVLADVPSSIEIDCDVDRNAFRRAALSQAEVCFRLWPAESGGAQCGTDQCVPSSALVVVKQATQQFDHVPRVGFARISAVIGN